MMSETSNSEVAILVSVQTFLQRMQNVFHYVAANAMMRFGMTPLVMQTL